MHDDIAFCSPTALAVLLPDEDTQSCSDESAPSVKLRSTEILTKAKQPASNFDHDDPLDNYSEDAPVSTLLPEDFQESVSELAYWIASSNPYAECLTTEKAKLDKHLPERHLPKSETQIEATRAKRMSSLRATNAEQWPGKVSYLTPESLQRLSPYVGAHVDSPCTAGDLIHALKCGHKIMTDNPEVCAANCIGAFVRYANLKDLDRAFNCNVCINEHLNAMHAGKLASTVDVHLVDPWTVWSWKSWLKTGIGFVNSENRPELQIACLDLQVRGRNSGAVFDPISFEYTGKLLSQTEQLLLATEGHILGGSCRKLACSSGDNGSKMGQSNGEEIPFVNVVDGLDNKAPQRRPLWTRRIPVIAHRLPRRKQLSNRCINMRTYCALALAGGVGASAQYVNATNSTSGYIHYETVTGYFLQDEPYTDPETFDYTAYNFGLMNRTYADLELAGNLTQWQKFEAQVQLLNNQAPLNTVFKVLFMGRHGEGFHNAAQDYYGTPAWNCYWSLKNGNETVSWRDADLTEEGIEQALIANSYWKSRIASQHIPYPQSYYSSPLTRCLRTANLTFADIPTPEYYPFVPTVKEFFREHIGLHTCDWRRSKTYVHNLFPNWNIEEGFAEVDPYWNGVTGETSDGQDKRSKIALDSVFSNDDHTWISITSHSGEIASMLRVLGHQSFSLNTGAVIPVLVKAQFLPSGPAASDSPFTTSTHCALPPITSGSDGCVCSGTASAGTTAGITTPIYNVSISTTAASYPTAYGSM
ncbi:phosphoglycerate mutase-like protein [Hortaea werneckii]|nr:phosphoglycerate mutase-like protein [Hortaea werneckii]KAI7720766.1 phosphoglycerate mutase-like protein [Hortaea werneckii]